MVANYIHEFLFVKKDFNHIEIYDTYRSKFTHAKGERHVNENCMQN
jgi:hypothetical protein